MFVAIHTLLQDCEHLLTVLGAVATLPPDAVSLSLGVVPHRVFSSATSRMPFVRACILKKM